MTTRDHRTSFRLFATLLLAPIALHAEQARAQTSDPSVAPVSPPPSAAVPPPPLGTAPAVGPVEVAPAPSDFAEPPPLPPIEAMPVVIEAPPSEPSKALEPAAQTPAGAETKPVEAKQAEKRAFASQDGGEQARGKPLFDVGTYHVQASGYVQGQYQNFQQSENQLSADGGRLLNNTGFSVPRVRAVIEGSNNWSAAVLEYDIANLNSAFSGVQRAEATLHWRNPKSNVPYLAGTFGVFRTPFGAEAERSARLRYYAENALVTQAFFPGQADLGFRAMGGVAWFRYAVAFVNGHPINEPRWGGRAPTKQGDVLGRLGVDADLGAVRIIGGASLLKGKGFSPGSPATKDTITVRDVNESGVVTPQSVTLIPGRAATASRTFERWGTGVDLELSANVADVWRFWLRGEFLFGQNLDRNLFISDPILLGYNQRSYGAVGSFDNIIYQVGLLGFRYDFYQPDPDSTARIGGDVVRSSRRIETATFLAGLQLPGTNTRIFAEYDRVKDHLALATSGRPADLKNNRFILRLQVSLW
jgi:hypothetical protein